MRRMFIVFGKLLGLVAFCLGLVEAPYVYFYVRLLANAPGGSLSLLMVLLGSVVYMTVSAALALLLMLRTDKVADWLKLKKDEELSVGPSMEVLLVAGSALIGVAMVASALPSLVKSLFGLASSGRVEHNSLFLRDPITQLLRLILGLLLVLKPRAIARFIAKRTRVPEEPAVSEDTPRQVPGED